MSQQEFDKRLNKIVNNEINLCKREYILAEILRKHATNRIKLEAKLNKLQEAKSNYQRENHILNTQNDKIRRFIASENVHIEDSKKRVDYLRQQIITEKQQQMERRKSMIYESDKLRCIKNLSKIYINTNRLPEAVQGTVVSEKETSTKLVPFKINPVKKTQEHIMEKLWKVAEESAIFDWNDLIMGVTDDDENGEKNLETNS